MTAGVGRPGGRTGRSARPSRPRRSFAYRITNRPSKGRSALATRTALGGTFRATGSVHAPREGSIAEQVATLADLKRKGLIRHVGVSNVTVAQVAEAQTITPVVCVQNHYNLAHRDDDALIDDLARQGIAY